MPAETNPVNITPAGVAVALLFLVGVVGTLRWMLRLPQPSPASVRVAEAVRQARQISRILVPAHGSHLSERMLGLAYQIAAQRGATLEVVYVQQISRLLPPDASVPDEERSAQEVLTRAALIAQRFGVKPRCRVVRAREAGPAIVRAAEDMAADLIVMGAGAPAPPRRASLGPAAEYVFRHAPCEVILGRAPIDEAPSLDLALAETARPADAAAEPERGQPSS